jgi:hypothetical protein
MTLAKTQSKPSSENIENLILYPLAFWRDNDLSESFVDE